MVQTRAGTAKPFALNYLLAFAPATLPIALDAGARRALDLGADYLICQGIEAGGHVQATQKLEQTFAQLKSQIQVATQGRPTPKPPSG